MALEAAAGTSLEEIKRILHAEDSDDEEAEPQVDDAQMSEPDILFTTLVGSKGLSAQHVFVLGLNDGHLPRARNNIADDEICSFLVALSRTRKRAHVISCKFFGKAFLRESVFLEWIRPHLEIVEVNKDYDFAE